MCSICDSKKMAGLHTGHLSRLIGRVPSVSLASEIFSALTKNLNPHLPALAAFVAMVEAVQAEDYGVLGDYRLVRLPLSIIGIDRARYRTPSVVNLHETILSLRMSEITIETLRHALRPHNLCVLFLCSCGVVMGACEDVRAYYGSHDHRRMDRLRSAIDATGSPLKLASSFSDIAVPTMDLHENGAEERLFARIEKLIDLMAPAGHSDYLWVDNELCSFVERAKRPESVLVIA